MDRRTFLKAGAVGLVASTFGCDPEQRKTAGQVTAAAAPIALLLPIPPPYAALVSLVMRVSGNLLQWDALWEVGDGRRTAEHKNYKVAPEQKACLQGRTPVVLQNQQGEDLNDKVLLPEQRSLLLANQTTTFKLSYRCPSATVKKGLVSQAPQFAAELAMLKIPCQFKNAGNGVAEVKYGNVSAWQFLYTPLKEQAEWWQTLLLRTGGFEANVQAV
jgi:hypothetical protein